MTERTEPLRAARRHSGSRAEQQAAELVARLRAGEVPCYTTLRVVPCEKCKEGGVPGRRLERASDCAGGGFFEVECPACHGVGSRPLSSEDVVRLLAFVGHEGARLLVHESRVDLLGGYVSAGTRPWWTATDDFALDAWVEILRLLFRLLPNAPDGRSAEEFMLDEAVEASGFLTAFSSVEWKVRALLVVNSSWSEASAREATQRAVLRCLLGDDT